MINEGYTEISSNVGLDGRVYKSTEGGNNEFYIQFKDTTVGYITVGFYEKYTPGTSGVAGVFGAGQTQNCLVWDRATPASDAKLSYIMNIDISRVIIQCEGYKNNGANACTSLTFVGMPIRYDSNDKGPNFGGVAGTTGTDSNIPTGSWKALRNRVLTQNAFYPLDYYMPTKSFGWGENIFYSPMFIGSADEGPRGEFPAIYALEAGVNTEFQHYDVFKRDGKTFIILSTANDYTIQSSYLPRSWYVMEVAEGLNYDLLYR